MNRELSHRFGWISLGITLAFKFILVIEVFFLRFNGLHNGNIYAIGTHFVIAGLAIIIALVLVRKTKSS